jgi:hypothetical protein
MTLALCSAASFLALHTASALEPVTVRSRSGQFTVRGLPLDTSWARYATGGVEYLRLDPSLAVVALERIRQATLTELGLDDMWRGPVHVNTFPVQDLDPRLVLTSVRFNDAWAYRLDLPEIVSKHYLVEIGVKVVLLEFANRNARGEQEAILPDWLVKGLSAELRATSLATLAPDTVVRREPNYDPLRPARATMRQRSALRFDDLAMPSQEQVSGGNAPVFDACAQVFVHELLRLRAGAACLSNMLVHLPENLNWQTTFLRAFQPHFSRLLDVDKWYSVTITSYSERDAMSVWPIETTLAQLEDVIATTVAVRAGPNELPVNTPVTLQRMIRDWNFARQYPVLSRKLQQLQALRLRGAPELMNLVEGYVQTLQSYLNSQPAPASRVMRNPPDSRAQAGIQTATRQLDALDAQRETMRLRTARAARAR